MLWVLASATAVVVVLCVPALIRALVRARRFRRIRAGDEAAQAAWDELRDTARDHGWEVSDAETPRAFAERLGAHLAGGGDAVVTLRDRIESLAYGPDAASIAVDEVSAVRRVIARSGGFAARARAVLLPMSVLSRGLSGRF